MNKSANDSKRYIVLCGVAIVSFLISCLIFACAINAHNAILGKSVLSIGRLFFERYVINGTMKPIVITEVCTGIIALACVVVIIFCIVSHFRTKSKNPS